MQARLLIIDPQKAKQPPMEPMLIVDDGGRFFVCTHDWALPVQANSLAEITEAAICRALRLRQDEYAFLALSPVRTLPNDDLTSPTLLEFTYHWWLDEVTDLARRGCIEAPPAILAAV